MSAVDRLFNEWLEERYPDGPDGARWHQDDLVEAFAAGWEACYHARWEPVGGLPVAERPAQKVFVVHEEPDMGYYGGAEVYGVFLDKAKAEERRREHPSDAVVAEMELEV